MSKSARVLRNIAALLLGQLGTWSASFILTLVVPSYLGARLYGLSSFVGTYASFFGLGVALGTGTFLTWRIAREPSDASKLLVNTLVMQVPLWAFWSIIAFALMPLVDGSALARQLIIISLTAMLFASLSSTCISALCGFQIMRVPAFIGVATAFAEVAYSIVLVRVHASLATFVTLYAINQFGNFAVMLIYTHRRIPLHAKVDVHLWPRIVAGSAPFFAWAVVLIFYWQVDIIMLKTMAGDTVVGWYSLASRLIGIPAFLPSIVVAATLPALSRERNTDSAYFRTLASRAIRLICAVNIPCSVGIIMLAPQATSLLHFPASFSDLSPLIIILSINMPIVALDMVLATVLTAMGRQNAWTCVGIVAAVLNPVVNLWAIPFTQHMFGNGAIGASLTTIQSEVIMFLGAMLLRPKSIFTRWDVWYIVRCLIAAAIMIPAVKAFETSTSNVSLILAAAYGGLIYILACYALRVLTEDDFKSAVSLVTSRLGMGDISGSNLDKIFERLAVASVRTAAHRRMSFARSTLSRPLGRVSRPLTHAWTAVVSQPLSRSTLRSEGTTSRYRNLYGWVTRFLAASSDDAGGEHYRQARVDAVPNDWRRHESVPETSTSSTRSSDVVEDVHRDEVLTTQPREIERAPIPLLPLHPLTLEASTSSEATHATANNR